MIKFKLNVTINALPESNIETAISSLDTSNLATEATLASVETILTTIDLRISLRMKVKVIW